MFIYVLCEVATVSQLCIFFPYVLHGLCEDYLTCDIAFNAVMPLSHASTRGSYSRIEGVTHNSHHLSETSDSTICDIECTYLEGVSEPPPHRESEVISISNNLTSTSMV